MKKRGINLFFFLVLFLSYLTSCTTKEAKRILIVHSYEDSYAGYPDINRLITKEFSKNGIHADLRILYLDCESYQEAEEIKRMYSMLDSVTDWKPEAIIVNDDQATYTLLKCGHPLVPQVPVVFGGVNYPNWELIKQYPNVTGFHDKMDFMPTIKMGKAILGDNINFFTLIDSTFLDRKIAVDLRSQLKDEKVTGNFMRLKKDDLIPHYKEKGYTYLSLNNVRYANLESSAGIIWMLSKYYRDRCYLQFKRDFTTVNISNITSSPSLTVINEAFGFGEKLLGGHFTPIDTQVREEVEAIVSIFQGKKPADMPIRESSKEYLVNWKIMDQLNIPVSKIPSQYTIVNMPFWVKYEVLTCFILIVVGLLLIITISRLVFLYRREEERKKKALAALADEKETLELAIAGSDTYAWKYENNKMVFESDFWQSIGKNAHELTIDELSLFVHPNNRNLFISYKQNFPNVRKQVTQFLCDFDGKGYQWWEFRYTTVCLETGHYRTSGLLLNIQSFKNREQELEKARLLAEKAELKESFLANMSHEIRTPLNAIVGFSTLLASDEEMDAEEKQDYIQSINRSNELLLKLINDILELSRLKSGFMSFTIEECLVSDIVDGVYSTHQMLIPSQLEFKKEVDCDTPLRVDIDKNRLTQVLTNFLNNACKFTKEGSITVGYKYFPNMKEVAIYVEDTGQGIDPTEKEIIFSRFYKHDEFAQGAGLGLSICQSIIEKLNGRIELWSEQGVGSRFTVVLPCKVNL